MIFNYIGALPTHCIKFYVRFTKTIMLNFHVFHVHIVHVYYIHILQNGWLEIIPLSILSFFSPQKRLSRNPAYMQQL